MKPPSSNKEVITLSPDERESAVSTIVLSFARDPMARWSMPDAKVFLTYFPDVVRAFAGKAFENGTAYQVAGYRGAAIWQSPGNDMDHDAMGAVMQKALPQKKQDEAMGIIEQMEHFHPKEPHWYLPVIGIDPLYQGQGYGTALLQHALQICDAEGFPAYLESSNPANIPLYQRHGFSLIGEIQSGSSPVLYPMLREKKR